MHDKSVMPVGLPLHILDLSANKQPSPSRQLQCCPPLAHKAPHSPEHNCQSQARSPMASYPLEHPPSPLPNLVAREWCC